MKNQSNNTELVGKFVSMVLWSDTRIVGKIVDTFGKSGIVIQRMVATKNTIEREYIKGGFAGVCINNSDQEWEFEMLENIESMRLSKQFDKQYMISNYPCHHYDYNF